MTTKTSTTVPAGDDTTTDTTAGDRSPDALLRRAHHAMDGVDELTAALATIHARRPQLTLADEADHIRDTTQVLLADGALPDNIGEQVLAVRRRNEARDAEVAVLARVEDDVRRRRRDAYAAAVDDGMATLRPVLDELVAEARQAFTRLDGIASAEQAIDAGPDAADAWTRVRTLGRDYGAVRHVQQRLLSDAVRGYTPGGAPDPQRVTRDARDLVRRCGYLDSPEDFVANLDDLFGAPPTRARPRGTDPAMPWVSGDNRADLEFLVTHDAVAVIPNHGQLLATQDRLRRARAHTGDAA